MNKKIDYLPKTSEECDDSHNLILATEAHVGI